MTGQIIKDISLNSVSSKKINLKFSKKKNQKTSNNKMSLKYLLSNNPDSKKKLSLLLNDKQNKINNPTSEIIVQKKELVHSNKNNNNISKNNYESKFNYQKRNTIIDCQNSGIKYKKLIKGGDIPEQKNKLNNILSVVSSPTNTLSTDTKKSNQKINSFSIKESFRDSNNFENRHGGNLDKKNMSKDIIKINKNTHHTKIIPDKRQFSRISGEQTIINHNVKKKTSNKSSKKTKVISLDIEKPKKSDNKKRTKFIHKVNSLRKKEIKQILVRNNLIKNNSKAPENLMKNILIDSVELGVNLV